MSILDRLLTDGRTLPKQGLIAWIKTPNSGAGYALPVSCFAAVGVGPWFSDATTPITRLMAEIIADPDINTYHIGASPRGGVWVFNPYTVLVTTVAKAQKYANRSLSMPVQLIISYNLLTINDEALLINWNALFVGA